MPGGFNVIRVIRAQVCPGAFDSIAPCPSPEGNAEQVAVSRHPVATLRGRLEFAAF
jgi:hypothetical protein